MSGGSPKSKKKPATRGSTQLVTTRVETPGAAATVVGRENGATVVNIEWDKLPRPERTFSANCARAIMRQGYPEVQFVQLHPLDDNRITNVVSIRYEMSRFVDRASANEPFRLDVEQALQERGERGQPGELCDHIDEADGQQANSVILDAESEWILRLEQASRMLFVWAHGRDLHRAIVGKTEKLPIQPILEVALPVRALADLLASWKKVADKIQRASHD